MDSLTALDVLALGVLVGEDLHSREREFVLLDQNRLGAGLRPEFVKDVGNEHLDPALEVGSLFFPIGLLGGAFGVGAAGKQIEQPVGALGKINQNAVRDAARVAAAVGTDRIFIALLSATSLPSGPSTGLPLEPPVIGRL